MVDYAEIIKSTVPMPEVAKRYTGEPIRFNRMRCPIHHGNDRNLRIYPKSYYCWVCHAAGDQIQFVQSVLGISFQDAMKRLNDDFGLNLPIGSERCDSERLERIDRQNRIRLLREQLEKIDYDLKCAHQANLAGLLNAVEIICQCDAPETPWDEWKPAWCMAMKLRTELMEEVK